MLRGACPLLPAAIRRTGSATLPPAAPATHHKAAWSATGRRQRRARSILGTTGYTTINRGVGMLAADRCELRSGRRRRSTRPGAQASPTGKVHGRAPTLVASGLWGDGAPCPSCCAPGAALAAAATRNHPAAIPQRVTPTAASAARPPCGSTAPSAARR